MPESQQSAISRLSPSTGSAVENAFDMQDPGFAAALALLDEGCVPQRSLRHLEQDTGAAEHLLRQLADAAIETMLSEPTDFGGGNTEALPKENDEFGATLSPAEEAALSDQQAIPPVTMSLVANGSVGAGFGAAGATTAMPTDEELEALLAGFDEEFNDAKLAWCPAPAEALARELDDHEDRDAIQAEGALEARGSVNAAEPAADHETLNVMGPLRRPLEPIGTSAPPRPWWLTPLELLSAPMACAPQSVRETVGKVALLALLNAVAVLVYVLVIRR